MGAIMAVGVASANSILLVTFAREQQLAGKTAFEAAIDAGRTRIRPVLMTAAAMIVGMIPMAIGGAGEEQNAALARAVIGGLLFATPTTLLVVPCLFAKLRSGNDGKAAHGVFEEELHERHSNRVETAHADAAASPQARRQDGRLLGLAVVLAAARRRRLGAWSHLAQYRQVDGDRRAAARLRAERPRRQRCRRRRATWSSACPAPRRPSRRPTSLPAPAATSTSATSISATG